MRTTRFGGFLLAIGAAVGVVGVVGLVAGFEPARLPPAMLNLAAYKLTFAAAVALLVAGAVVLRRANREKVAETSRHPISETGAAPPAVLAPATGDDDLLRQRDPAVEKVPRAR